VHSAAQLVGTVIFVVIVVIVGTVIFVVVVIVWLPYVVEATPVYSDPPRSRGNFWPTSFREPQRRDG
jgi:hypothetical protein